MSESGAARPAARAITPPSDATEGAVSTARLVTPMAERVPPAVGRVADGEWATFGTAPTLLLTPPLQPGDERPDPSIAAIVEEKPWFKTGTTVPPPSVRPPADSVVPPALRNPPSPRVLKIVGGVIAACLCIVALAGIKVLYLRLRAPVTTSAPTEESTPAAPHATAVAPVALPAAEGAKSHLDPAPAAPVPSAQPSSAGAAARTTPTRPSASPPRVTAKPSTHRAPTTKKVGKSR
jgi:hypothetical protein